MKIRVTRTVVTEHDIVIDICSEDLTVKQIIDKNRDRLQEDFDSLSDNIVKDDFEFEFIED